MFERRTILHVHLLKDREIHCVYSIKYVDSDRIIMKATVEQSSLILYENTQHNIL